ncbi:MULTISPECIES: hypothetical protein [Rhizobium/Agrobacterium group]|uniref:hypothetical protein n=1 Tax=Rhizobium/Agrobacterium group TaxID=227290 RepID=UPI0023010ADC|nr:MULTISPECIES: hypothetical protein [Rhizobium/Agrobacterium group]MDA5636023.1 hypothetical protein [Agrobacterium sp. ST15.16.024]MDF1891067.1 hypothetical protein [Rhizobium rhizogenes]
MLWNLEKLENERADLIEVITGLTHLERLQHIDRNTLSMEIAAHMSRLSDLDAEIQRYALLMPQTD